MKKKINLRFLAILLSLVMVFGVMPLDVLAATGEDYSSVRDYIETTAPGNSEAGTSETEEPETEEPKADYDLDNNDNADEDYSLEEDYDEDCDLDKDYDYDFDDNYDPDEDYDLDSEDEYDEIESVIAMELSMAVLTIVAPTAANVQVFQQGNFHQITPLEVLFENDLEDGRSEFGFPAGGTHYRVSMAGKITRTGFVSSGNVNITFGDNEDPQTQIHDVLPAILAQRVEASTMVNVNERNHLTMNVNETFRLRGFRAPWEIINGDTTNMIIQPDFHVNILSGANIIDVQAVANQSHWFDITALQAGTAIIEVYYDAIRNVNGGVDNLYAATHPDRKSVVVITVDGNTGSVNFDSWDTEFDTVYYLNTQNNGYFPVNASGVQSVDVAHVSNGALRNWRSVSAVSGIYNVPVSAGNNIVRVRDSSGRLDYQVVRAARITPVFANTTNPGAGASINPGDRFTLRFEGLFAHAPKIGNIYNPTLAFFGEPAGNRIGYTLAGTRVYAGDQYRFINMHTMTFTAPNADGHFMITDGNLPSSIFGFVGGFGAHRNLGDNGVANSGIAPTFRRNSSILPDVPITVGTPEAPVDWEAAMTRALDRIVNVVSAPQFGSVGGEWAVLALARSEHVVPAGYFDAYLLHIGNHLAGLPEHTDPNHTAAGWVLNPDTGRREVRLANAQSTENARLIVALTALGIDASSFEHNGHTYDLVSRLGNRHAAGNNNMWGVNQGINGPTWNLIALNARGWDTPYEISDRAWVGDTTVSNPITLDERISWILNNERTPAGWSLSGGPDPDITAMVIQAFAPYYGEHAGITAAINRALVWLEGSQTDTGGWRSWGTYNVQSTAQVIVALTMLGIDPQTDARFIMPEGNPITSLLSFQDDATGGFRHGGSINLMATEQAAYALVAYWRLVNDMTALYDMSDAFAAPPIDNSTEITLSTAGTYTFPAATAGYSARTPHTVTITNIGNTATGELTIALSGANAGSFALNTTSIPSIASANGTADFTVVPNTGLTAGTYTAIVTVSGTNVTAQSFTVNFTVNNAIVVIPAPAIRLDPAGDHIFTAAQVGYSQRPHRTVTVTSVGNEVTGALSVALSGANAGSFTLSRTSIPSIPVWGQETFTVVPNDSLAVGTYTATVTVSGVNVAPQSFNVRFTVRPAVNVTEPRVFLRVADPNSIRPDHPAPYVFFEGYVPIRPGTSTAYSVLRYNTGLNVRSSGSAQWAGMYVQAINDWGEFDGGALSGWMYRVNNRFPMFSSSFRLLRDGDTVEWLYTYDLGLDIGANIVQGSGPNVRELFNAIGDAEQLTASDWARESWANMQAALTAALAVLDSAEAGDASLTQAQVDAAVAALRAAIDALVPYGEGPPPANVVEVPVVDGIAVAEDDVIQQLIEDTLEEGKTNLVIALVQTEASSRVELQLTVRLVSLIVENELTLTVSSDIAALDFDLDTLGGIVRDEDEDLIVRIIAELVNRNSETTLNQMQRDVTDSNTVIFLKVMVGDRVVENFEGTVTVTIPYTPPLRFPAEFYDLLTVYRMDDVGNICEMLGASYYDGEMTFTTSHFSLFFVREWINPFVDMVRSDRFYRDMRFVYSHEIMGGTTANTFAPDAALARDEMTKILWQMAGAPLAEYDPEDAFFAEMTPGQRNQYHANTWADDNAISDGLPIQDATLTLEAFALILYNYARFNEINTEVDADFADEYFDMDSISPWAAEAIWWANATGIINTILNDVVLEAEVDDVEEIDETTNAVFNATDIATRGAAAAMLRQLVEYVM